MCRHDKDSYAGYDLAAEVARRRLKRGRKLGQSREAAKLYRCPICRQWLLTEQQGKVEPYSRPRAKAEVRRLIMEWL